MNCGDGRGNDRQGKGIVESRRARAKLGIEPQGRSTVPRCEDKQRKCNEGPRTDLQWRRLAESC